MDRLTDRRFPSRHEQPDDTCDRRHGQDRPPRDRAAAGPRASPVRAASRSSETPFDWNDRATWAPALRGASAAYISYFPDLAVPGRRRRDRRALRAGACAAACAGSCCSPAAARRRRSAPSARCRTPAPTGRSCAAAGSPRTSARAAFAGVGARPASSRSRSTDVGEPFVDADDIADVAVAALTEDGHAGQLYELTGPAAADVRRGGRRDRRRVAGRDGARSCRSASTSSRPGWPSWACPRTRSTLLRFLFTEVLDGRNAHVTDGVQRALGREPTDFARLRAARLGAAMITPGQTLENPVTGERFTFTHTAASTGGELLAFDFALRPGGAVPMPHVHPIQTERFEVTAGRMRFRVGLRTVARRPGRRRRGRARRHALVRQRGRRGGAAARGGPPRAGDGGDVRRGRRAGEGRADDPARSAAQPARPGQAGAQVRSGGARTAPRRPAAAALLSPLLVLASP